MNDFVKLIIWVVVIGAVFGFLWYQGVLNRIATYVTETREELKKCSWPSREELKGSTIVVMVTVVLLSIFTVGIDAVVSIFVRLIHSIT